MATAYHSSEKKKIDGENLPQNLSNLPMGLLDTCISKAYYMGKTWKNLANGERQELNKTLMSVDLTWLKIMEQLLKHKTTSRKKPTYGVDHLTRSLKVIDYSKDDNSMVSLKKIYVKDNDIIPDTSDKEMNLLKRMLEKVKFQKVQLEELLEAKESERHLFETELNRTLLEKSDLQKRLEEADSNNKCLKIELTVTRKEVEATKMQLLEANDAAKLEEVKAMFEEAQSDIKTLKEEMTRKDNEILQLRERIVSTEEIAGLLHQRLRNSEHETHRQKELLDTTTSENVKLRKEIKQLGIENDLLKTEIDQLKEKLDQQSKLIEEQKYDSGSLGEKTITKGSDNDDIPCGYPKEIFSEEVDDKYLCTRCTRVLKNPIQSFCGHRFCKDCFDHLIRQDNDDDCKVYGYLYCAF